MQSPPKIGIFLAGALGDFILSLPALTKLREVFPAAEIDLIGNPSWLPLARQGPWTDRVCSMEELPIHAGFQAALSKDHPLFRFLASYNLIISWFGDKNGEWEKTLKRACPGKVQVMPLHQCHSYPGHMSDYYLSTLKRLGIEIQQNPGDVARDEADEGSFVPRTKALWRDGNRSPKLIDGFGEFRFSPLVVTRSKKRGGELDVTLH